VGRASDRGSVAAASEAHRRRTGPDRRGQARDTGRPRNHRAHRQAEQTPGKPAVAPPDNAGGRFRHVRRRRVLCARTRVGRTEPEPYRTRAASKEKRVVGVGPLSVRTRVSRYRHTRARAELRHAEHHGPRRGRRRLRRGRGSHRLALPAAPGGPVRRRRGMRVRAGGRHAGPLRARQGPRRRRRGSARRRQALPLPDDGMAGNGEAARPASTPGWTRAQLAGVKPTAGALAYPLQPSSTTARPGRLAANPEGTWGGHGEVCPGLSGGCCPAAAARGHSWSVR